MIKRFRLLLCALIVLLLPVIIGFGCSTDEDDDNTLLYLVIPDPNAEFFQLSVMEEGTSFPIVNEHFSEKESDEAPEGYDPWIAGKYMPSEDCTLIVLASSYRDYMSDPGFIDSAYVKFQGNDIGEYTCTEARIKTYRFLGPPISLELSSQVTNTITITKYGGVGERIEGTFEIEVDYNNDTYNATGSFSIGRDEDDNNNPLARILL